MVRPTINSQKHINQLSPVTTAAGVIATSTFIEAVAVDDIANQTHVREGATVKAVFVEMWLTSDDAAQASFQINCEILPAAATTMTFTQSNTLGSYPNKKNVLYITRGLGSTTTGTPIPAIRQWIAIPKGKQRFGLGDKFVINFTAIANGLTHCGFVLFKEYY